MGLFSLICIIVGVVMVMRFFEKKKEMQQEKGIIFVLGGTLLLVYLFPGAGLLIIGLILLMLFGLPGCY